MGGTPPRYVATELSKLGRKGMTAGHLGLNPDFPLILSQLLRKILFGKINLERKSWVQGWARGLGLESSNVSQLWIGVQFSFFFFWSKLWNGFKDASSGHLHRVYYCCCRGNVVCPPLENIHSGMCAFTIGTSETSWFCGASVWLQLSCSPGTTVPPWSFVSAKLYTVAFVAGLEVPASLTA